MTRGGAQSSPSPVPALRGARGYSVPRHPAPCDLRLDANEAPGADAGVLEALGSLAEAGVHRYPVERRAARALASLYGVDERNLLATAGGDEAIDRLCRAYVAPGSRVVVHAPSFEMIEHSARLCGAEITRVPWAGGAFPRGAFVEAIGQDISLVALVTPNNPTGATIAWEDVERVAEAAGEVGAAVLLDLAYVEFADDDPTARALGLDNAAVVRTLSKAYGLAGLRVGALIAPEAMVEACRAAGGPYTVGAAAVVAAEAVAGRREQAAPLVERVRSERGRIAGVLGELGYPSEASEANFVLARGRDPMWVRDALASLGVAVRAFPGRAGLEDAVRVTCPGGGEGMARLEHALRTALSPEAILFDLDGVIADVSRSYRAAIVRTAESFGVQVTREDVAEAKLAGDANNDWVLTQRLLVARGETRTLEEVTERFESIYQGADGAPGLRDSETLLAEAGWFERLAARYPLGIVTGRPRRDAELFLDAHGIRGCFSAMVCMEDGPAKPAPDGVLAALRALGAERGWFVGDTIDDVDAGRAAAAVTLGVRPPGEDTPGFDQRMLERGCARMLPRLEDLEGLLP